MTELDAQTTPTDETEAAVEPPALDQTDTVASEPPDALEPELAAAPSDEVVPEPESTVRVEIEAPAAPAEEVAAATPVVEEADAVPEAASGTAPSETAPEPSSDTVPTDTADAGPRTVGRFVAEALRAAGVRYAFTVPGESFLGLLDALEGAGIRVVATRHEGAASFMA
ncbi:MAG TPA: thiamine pyrophosphate-binding protein, partial [Candidatus Limnocylindrales bacterium]|nr:thiamine pyrophosphate-binding protein [Candidatus Limnocylindrales bacterium]